MGMPSKLVKLGPGVGLDNGIVSIGGSQVLILTVDPISAIPAFGASRSAWLSVHLIASDFTTSGHDPCYATFTYNFPKQMSEADREEYIRAVGRECDRLGVAIVGGHTGSYPGAGLTVIGSGSMLGVAPENGYIAPSMAGMGHTIVMTKHAAIEATCSLATSFIGFLESKVGTLQVKRAIKLVSSCSTVADARAARSVGLGAGGVSSMHDATEGGIVGALHEMATASEKRFVVRTHEIPVSPESRAVCGAFGLDPLETMGEGSLLITCAPSKVGELRLALRHGGIASAEIGSVGEGEGLVLEDANGKESSFTPRGDAYWRAYSGALARRLR